MLDFTPSPHAAFSDAFEAVIDAAMEAHNRQQAPRTYLGASRLGEECERKLGYEYHHHPKDEGRNFKGATLRIFDRGHDAETRMADYLRRAGFTVLTEKPNGGQFGFQTAWDEQMLIYRISGHCDGVITAGPGVMAYPALWEMKALGDKGWKDTVKKGVKVSKPVYYAQMQLYMAYLGLTDNPGLFTALNGNDGRIYAELVPFDPAAAQAASDRGARVVSALTINELPRIGRDSTDFRCKFCDFAGACWAEKDPAPAAPGWATGWRASAPST
jgi:hypothetical protein